ncbi:hypothetical protein AmDm5_3006 [Acetobacter malorum]|nr:hypothetical protein AmDm5_3006 [Acetobacter malorum]
MDTEMNKIGVRHAPFYHILRGLRHLTNAYPDTAPRPDALQPPYGTYGNRAAPGLDHRELRNSRRKSRMADAPGARASG